MARGGPVICYGGPLDGDTVGDRGEMFQPVSGTGVYVRRGGAYHWHPNINGNPQTIVK